MLSCNGVKNRYVNNVYLSRRLRTPLMTDILMTNQRNAAVFSKTTHSYHFTSHQILGYQIWTNNEHSDFDPCVEMLTRGNVNGLISHLLVN